ncbi:MAG: TldD/PmbA family protein [Candidatus Lokiarchaeota archaeon]
MGIDGNLVDLADFTLFYAQEKQIDYVEIRLESNKRDTIAFINGNLYLGNLPIEFTDEAFNRKIGINVRIITNGGLGMCSTNYLSKPSLRQAVNRAYKNAKGNGIQREDPIELSKEEPSNVQWQSNYKRNPMNVSLEEKIKFFQDFAKIFLERKYPIHFLHIFVLITEQRDTYYLNNERSKIQGHIPRVAFLPVIIGMKSGGKNEQLMANYATTSGWDELLSYNLVEKIRDKVKILSEIITRGKKPPEGQIDLILGPDVAGIISHENCGHPFEADRILGREGAQAGESYLRDYKIGDKVGNECVNIYEDPTIPGSYGFYLYDDEGVKVCKRELIKNGIFNEMLHNRETAGKFNVNSNGAARAVSYDREPIIRMANTYFAPGEYSFEEMIEDIKMGVYIKSFSEWNIDDKRNESKYVGQEAYLIENGEIKGLVTKPILEISSIGLFNSIDAQGNEIKWQGAFCGKSDPGQGCPVWTGGPNIRLREVRLG